MRQETLLGGWRVLVAAILLQFAAAFILAISFQFQFNLRDEIGVEYQVLAYTGLFGVALGILAAGFVATGRQIRTAIMVGAAAAFVALYLMFAVQSSGADMTSGPIAIIANRAAVGYLQLIAYLLVVRAFDKKRISAIALVALFGGGSAFAQMMISDVLGDMTEFSNMTGVAPESVIWLLGMLAIAGLLASPSAEKSSVSAHSFSPVGPAPISFSTTARQFPRELYLIVIALFILVQSIWMLPGLGYSYGQEWVGFLPIVVLVGFAFLSSSLGVASLVSGVAIGVGAVAAFVSFSGAAVDWLPPRALALPVEYAETFVIYALASRYGNAESFPMRAAWLSVLGLVALFAFIAAQSAFGMTDELGGLIAIAAAAATWFFARSLPPPRTNTALW